MPSFERFKDLKISIITKYSKYKPKSENLKIYQIHKYNNFILDTIYFIIRSFFKIINIHKKENIDILKIHNFQSTLLSPYLIRIFFKIPIILKLPIDFSSLINDIYMSKKHKLRTKIINLSWFRFFKYFILKKIHYIRAINKKMEKDLLKLKFPKKNILSVPNGISIKKLKDLKKIEHIGTHYGFVGRLIEFKNLRFLLDVFKIYISKYPEDKLLIYGKGVEEEYINKFIDNNHLEKQIIYCGFERNIRKIFSNLDVLIDPALGQGISNANLQAMCTNTFLIASNVYGNTDIVKDNITGLLFNPFEIKNLLEKLIFYKKNKERVEEIKINAKKEISLYYDIDKITERIYNFLKLKLNLKKSLILK